MWSNFIKLLKRLASITESKYRVPVLFQSTLDKLALEPQIKRILFRSIRELIFNFIKHDGSATINMRVEQEQSQLMIHLSSEQFLHNINEIQRKINQKTGYGLLIINENLALIGARITLRNDTGSFCISLVI